MNDIDIKTLQDTVDRLAYNVSYLMAKIDEIDTYINNRRNTAEKFDYVDGELIILKENMQQLQLSLDLLNQTAIIAEITK